jgi:hypothetical protein
VHVPRPTSPATIAIPDDNSTTTSADTTVVGTCPLVSPQAVVVITVDSTNVGSSICDDMNKFNIAVTLPSGPHTIVANAYSVDGDPGPSGQPVHVTYKPTGTAATTASIPPSLLLDSPFVNLGANNTATWSGTLSGSAKSYNLLVDWGDDVQETFKVGPGAISKDHQYANNGSHNIILAVSDGGSDYTHLQLAAATYNTYIPPVTGGTYGDNSAAQTSAVVGLYGLFVTLVAVAAIARLHAAPFAYASIKITHHHA